MRWSLLLLSLLCATCLVTPLAHGQTTGQFQPVLDLRIESQPSEALVHNGAAGNITIRWTYTFKETTTAVLAQSSTGTTIHFTPAPTCSASGLLVTGPASVRVEFAGPGPTATKTSYEGVVEFDVRAGQEAPMDVAAECTFSAAADAVNSQIVATEAAPVKAMVSTAGNATVDCTMQAAGCPQTDANPSPVVHPAFVAGMLVAAAVGARRRLA